MLALVKKFGAWLPLIATLLPSLPFVGADWNWGLVGISSLYVAAEKPAACPADMVLVDGLYCPRLRYACMNPPDVTGKSRCFEYLKRGLCDVKPEPRRYCIDRYEWPNKLGEKPKIFVDWYTAKKSCAAVGKRLCARSEWMFACEGPKRLPFPWGNTRHPSPCNIDRAPIPFDMDRMMDPETQESELTRLWQADSAGDHPRCVSAWGAYDMSGNVDEWTDESRDVPGTKHPSTLNGGYWGPVRDTCRLTTTSHGPKFKFYQVGFRCCADTQDGVEASWPKARTARLGRVTRKKPWVSKRANRRQSFPKGRPSSTLRPWLRWSINGVISRPSVVSGYSDWPPASCRADLPVLAARIAGVPTVLAPTSAARMLR